MTDTNRKQMRDIWYSMVNRCYNPKHISYKYYGEKGIEVCDRWRYSFDNFLSDMGYKPQGKSLDRIDNSKGYGRSNCRWVDIKTQNNNKSDTRKITFKGKTQNMTEWALEIKTSPAALYHRLYKMNLSIEIALTEPFSRKNAGRGNKLQMKEIK